MAEANITTSEEILDCPICLEQYRTPRSLPCLHSFCEECLDSYITSHTDNSTDFLCPVCRSTVTLPSPKSSIGSPAQTFPLNHLIVPLMDGGVENKADITCTPCLVRDDSSEKAIYWCNDCCEGLCEKCFRYHRKSRSSSKHRPVIIAESSNITVQASANIYVDENCARHGGKVLEVFCSDHSELCCVVCFATKHRECKHIHSIDDISEGLDLDGVCSKITNEMKEIEEAVLSLASVKEISIVKVDEEVKVITTEITDEVDKAKVKLDSARDTLISDVKQRSDTEKQKLKRQQKLIQAFQKDATNCCNVMTSVTAGTKRQAFIILQRMKSQLTNHYQQLKAELTNDVDIHLKFHAGTFLTKLDTTGFVGKVETEEIPCVKTSDITSQMENHLDNLVHCTSSTYAMDLMKASVRLVKVVTSDDVGLDDVNFAGGAFLQDGRLLIADYSNGRLVLLDDKFKVVNNFPVVGTPADVTIGCDDSNIFVCMDEINKIIKYKLRDGKELIQTKELSFPHCVWSASAFDKFLIVGPKDGSPIVKVSMEGYEMNIACNKSRCVHVAKHDANQTYYRTIGNSVVCTRVEGEEVFRYDTGRDIGGMGVDRDGNICVGYACDDVNKTAAGVYQVSRDGRQSRVLVEALNSITDPYTVIFHRTKPLFVVVSDEDDTVFEVYEFVP